MFGCKTYLVPYVEDMDGHAGYWKSRSNTCSVDSDNRKMLHEIDLGEILFYCSPKLTE